MNNIAPELVVRKSGRRAVILSNDHCFFKTIGTLHKYKVDVISVESMIEGLKEGDF